MDSMCACDGNWEWEGLDFDGGEGDEGETCVTDGECDVETALYLLFASLGGFELHFLTNSLCFFVEGWGNGLHDVGFGDSAFFVDDAGYDDASLYLAVVHGGVLEVFEHEFVQCLFSAFELWTLQGLTLLTVLGKGIVSESEIKELGVYSDGCGK